jgi:hypothetical protein
MPLSDARAVRYRRLALASRVKADADLLLKLADECDRGVLCAPKWRSALPPKLKTGDTSFRFGWDFDDRR